MGLIAQHLDVVPTRRSETPRMFSALIAFMGTINPTFNCLLAHLEDTDTIRMTCYWDSILLNLGLASTAKTVAPEFEEAVVRSAFGFVLLQTTRHP